MVAALGAIVKTAVKSQVKKVAADKLMGRGKKKQPQQQKQSSNAEVGGKKGGAIVKAPISAMANIPLADSVSAISQTPAAGGGVGGSDTILVIKTRVVEIEKILKGSVALDKKILDQERKQREKELRTQEESELETPKDGDEKKVKKKKTKVKLGFLDGLINFIKEVLTGFILVRLIKFLPQLKKIASILGGALDFFTNIALGLVDGLGTLLMWGDKAITGTRNLVKNIFGDKGAEIFDGIVGTIGNLFNTIAILGMTAAAFGSGGKSSKQPKRGPKNKLKRAKQKIKRFTDPKRASKLNRVKNIKKIKVDRLARVKKFGNLKKFAKAKQFVGKSIDLGKNIVKTGSKLTRTATKGITTAAKTATTAAKSVAKTATTAAKSVAKTATTAAKTATTTATKLGKTGLKTGLKGLKSLKKVVSPIVKKIPFIGALLDFVLNYFVFKEPLGRAAFMAIGAGLAAWLGGIIGSVIPVGGTLVGAALGGWAGDKLAGALYDAIFKKKDPKDSPKNKEKKKKTTKTKTVSISGNNEGYLSMLSSGKRGKIEQALYEMRIDSVKTGEAHSDMVGNPKYAGDVDLIMKHGMQAVEISNGRVTLQKSFKASLTPVDVNSVASKTNSISKSASYEDGAEEVIVINSSAPSGGGGETQSNETMPVATASTGGGDDLTEALYEGG